MNMTPNNTNNVICSLKNKVANNRVNNGYVQVTGTALETPINFKLNIYKVSPTHKPIAPLRPAKSNESTRKAAKYCNLPVAPKHAMKNTVVDIHREMLAETGFASDNATLYKTADTVQHNAAPKAASSPSILITHAFASSLCKTVRATLLVYFSSLTISSATFPKLK